MILTEEEARTKWCPETPRKESADGYLRGQYCIGSDCMAWQLVPAWKLENGLHYTSNQVAGGTHLGYCGKGGKP